MNILIVDDDLSLQNYLRQRFTRWEYQVKCAQNGAEAVDLCSKIDFQLILLDLYLPQTDIVELIQLLKILCMDTDIISMTGSNSPELERSIRELGILYYLIKPFEIDNLKAILEHLSVRRNPSSRIA